MISHNEIFPLEKQGKLWFDTTGSREARKFPDSSKFSRIIVIIRIFRFFCYYRVCGVIEVTIGASNVQSLYIFKFILP